MVKLVAFLIWLVFTCVLIEGASFVFATYFYENPEVPDYVYRSDLLRGKIDGFFTESDPWGAWHKRNSSWSESKKCFNVKYETNSYGARDDEHPRISEQARVLMLGDSFVEGLGVEKDQRITEILAQRIRSTVLNFGCQKNLGPLQYRILYEQLALSFDHNVLIVLVLPDNDFTDNWLPFWRHKDNQWLWRYRPYYGSCGADWCPTYLATRPTDQTSNKAVRLSPQQKLIQYWKHFSYTWSTYKAIIEIVSPESLYSRRLNYSGYRDASEAQIDAVLSSIGRLKQLAGSRRMIVALIPRPNDLKAVMQKAPLPTVEKFRAAAVRHKFELVELGGPMLDKDPNYENWYLSCDGHWSALGHQLAAEVLAERLSQASPYEAASHD